MSQLPPAVASLCFADRQLSLATRILTPDAGQASPDQPQALPPLQLQLLLALTEAPGRLWTRAQLIERLWPDQAGIEHGERLDFHIAQLRRRLNDSPRQPRFIQTVRGAGFRFLPPVTQVTSAPNAPPSPPSRPADLPPTPLPPGGRRLAAFGLVAAVAGLLLLALGWRALPRLRPFLPTASAPAAPVYLTESVQGHFRIARLSPLGRPTLLSMPWPDALLLSASTATGTLAVETPVPIDPLSTDAPLWLLRNGGKAQPLGIAGHAAAWRPDGQQLLVARGRLLWQLAADGSRGHLLAALPAPASRLRWAADGHSASFQLTPHSGSAQLWRMDADGSHLQPVSDPSPLR